MVSYLSKFIWWLSDLKKPLRILTQKDTQFSWTPSPEKQFNIIKQAWSSTSTLTYFGHWQTHHSPGRCIQNWWLFFKMMHQLHMPVRHRLTLNVNGPTLNMKPMHWYLDVNDSILTYMVKIESDHKPLEQITHKSLADTQARLQRMMMWLQPYDIELKFRPGKDMKLPDALSRYHLQQGPEIAWI